MENKIYFVRTNSRAYYSLLNPEIEAKEDIQYWIVSSEYLLPYINDYPNLLNHKQFIKGEDRGKVQE